MKNPPANVGDIRDVGLIMVNTVEVRNRFKGLDLIDTVSEKLWMEVRDIDRRQGSRASLRTRNAKKRNGYLRRPYK